MAARNQRDTTPDAFVVVVNDEDQRALWRAGLDVPSGWRRASAVMTRGECLTAIDRGWPDIAPASVRAGGASRAGGGGGANGDRLVHEVVAEQAVRRPDAVAVIAGRTQVSYRELDSSANRLARYLGEIGAGPEAVIGVYLERGVDVIRAILAIMKAGAGDLPLDPSLPPERLNAICSQVRPTAVIAARAGAFPGAGTRLLPLGELAAELASLAGHAADGRRASRQPLLRHLHLGIDRGPQAGRRQPPEPGLRYRRAGRRVRDRRRRPGDADGLDGLRHLHRAGIRRADERRDPAAAATGHDGAVGAAAPDRAQARHRARPDARLLAPAARADRAWPTSGCAASG